MPTPDTKLQHQVQSAIDDFVASNVERALQVAVYQQGELVVDAVAGLADPTLRRPMFSDTPVFSYSIGKGMAATAAHVLAERGVLSYDTPIVELWPEFGAHDKEKATVRHALSQSLGTPYLPPGLTVDDLCDWDKMTAIVADAKLEWEPGTKIGYHAVTWGYIVGEIVRRASGKPIAQVLYDEIATPLGVADELFFAIPKDDQGRLAVLEDAPVSEEMAAYMDQMPADSPFFKLGPAEATTAAFGNNPAVRSATIPAGGTVTARAVARMYAALLGEVDGVRLISPERLREVSAVAASGEDAVFGFPTAWGLGYSLGQSMANAAETQHIFGVGGVGGSIANADTKSGVVFALTKNRLAADFDTADKVGAIVSAG